MADKARTKMLEKSIQKRGKEQKKSMRVLDSRFRGRLQYGDRNVTPTQDRDAFGNDRPLERQPSGPVTPKKDL